jgi:hypothetical protein
MSSDPHPVPGTTREFLAVWNDTVEEHLTSQLAQVLPSLAGEPGLRDSAQVATLARQLVRALRLSASSGDAAVAIRYLADLAQAGEVEPTA